MLASLAVWYAVAVLVNFLAVSLFPSRAVLVEVFSLTAIPALAGKTPGEIGLKNFKKGAIFGIASCALILVPFAILCTLCGGKAEGSILSLTAYFAPVSIAEEVFFRGFLYSELRFSGKAGIFLSRENVLTSGLFALAHAVTYRDIFMLRTFFPSLVMGWLYERTGSVASSAVFHLFSDVVYKLLCFSVF